MKYALGLVVLLAVAAGCDKEDPTRPIFTFTLKDDFYAQYGADTWIVIRDNDNGELIDSKQILDKNQLVFESNKPISSNKLSITILRVYTAGNDNKNNYAQVYNGIDVGSNWIVAQRTTSNQISIKALGTFQFRIEDLPALTAFSISDKFGDFSYNVDYLNNTITGGFSIHEDAPRQLVVVNIGDKPKYLWLEDLVGGEQLNLSYSDFKEFDKYVEVDVPDDQYSGSAINTTVDNFVLNHEVIFSSTPKRDVLYLGYLDEFSSYNTYVYSSYWDHSEIGPVPASIQYLDGSDFHTSGNTIDDYTITATSSYQYSSIIFSQYDQPSNTSTQIVYQNPEGTSKLHEPLTEELASKYSIPVDKVRGILTTFSLGEDDVYENQIKYLFDPTYQLVVTKSVHVMK